MDRYPLPLLSGPECKPRWIPGSEKDEEKPPSLLQAPSAAGVLRSLFLRPSPRDSASTSVHLSSLVLGPMSQIGEGQSLRPFLSVPAVVLFVRT